MLFSMRIEAVGDSLSDQVGRDDDYVELDDDQPQSKENNNTHPHNKKNLNQS